MKKKWTAVVFVFLGWSCCNGQVMFQKKYAGTDFGGKSIQQTFDGGYILAGYQIFLDNTYLAKTNAFGDTTWTRIYAGIEASFVIQTFDSNYVVVGVSSSANYNACLIKVNVYGDTLWTKNYLVNNANGWGLSIRETADHGYILLANAKINAGYYDMVLIKTDADGNVVWSKSYSNILDDYGTAVQQTTDGGYAITGSYGDISNGTYEGDVLIKTDSIGNLLWSKRYVVGISGEGFYLEQTNDHGYILIGDLIDVGYLVKTDSSGNFIWSRTLYNSFGLVGRFVHQTYDGGYIVIGTGFDNGTENFCLFKTDSVGNSIWARDYGGSFYGSVYAGNTTSDGGYVIFGVGSDSSIIGGIFLVKTDLNGSSGCNETSPTDSSNIPLTVTFNYPLTDTSISVAVISVVTAVSYGGTVTTLCSSVFTPEIPTLQSEIYLSPNPAAASFSISGNFNDNEVTVAVTDITGRTVLNKKMRANKNRIDVTLPGNEEGIYFVTVTNIKGEFATSKIALVGK